MRRAVVAVGVLALLTLLACSQPTSVRVSIDAESGVRTSSSRVSIVVRGASSPGARFGERVFDQTFRPGDGDPPYPFTVVLAPHGNDATRIFEITATASDGDSAFVAEARIIGGYLPGQERRLHLRLEDSCIDIRCGEEQTCAAGRCIDARESLATIDASVSFGDAGTDGWSPVDGGDIDSSTVADASTDAAAPVERWTELPRLDGAGPAVAVSADGARVAVGDEFGDRVTIYRIEGGAPRLETTLSPGASGIRFGGSIALSADGSRIVVGSYYDSMSSPVLVTHSGSVWIYRRSGTTWTADAQVFAPDAAQDDNMGTSVTVDAAGAHFAAAGGGAVHVFGRSGSAWSREARITRPVGGAFVGAATALDGAGLRIVVGDQHYRVDGSIGSVYVFGAGDGWLTAERSIPGATVDGSFGMSVALSAAGDVLLAGGPGEDGASAVGLVRSFTRVGSTWTSAGELRPSAAVAGDLAGVDVAMSSDGLVAFIAFRHGVAVFTRSTPSSWAELTSIDTGDIGVRPKIAVSGDGRLLAVGVGRAVRLFAGSP